MFVGVSFGKFFSHIQVVFLASSPNWYGCIIWSGFLYLLLIIHTGFSIAILSMGALTIAIKKSIHSCCLPSAIFFAKCLAQLQAK
jgi:hypothetical protein